MRYESLSAKAPLLYTIRIMSPTPLQNSDSSFEEEQGQFEVEDQIWSARDRTVIAKTKRYLVECNRLKVESRGVGILAGPRGLGCGFQANLGGSEEQIGSRDL